MAKWQYTRGTHDIGKGCYAYLQPDGGWGWSNAGLIVDGDATMLVDTLFDLKLTAQMLDSLRDAVPAAAQVGTLVNTHANGDHTYGNQLVKGARIIASEAAKAEFDHLTPQSMRDMMATVQSLGRAGSFIYDCLHPFDFSGIELTWPHQTFTGELEVTVGSKKARLIEVGPAHTRGDILVHLPEEKVVFTGDIMFVEGTPVTWDGPISNWIRALDRILSLDVDVVVPGHGPVTDRDGVRAMRGYLEFVTDEARRRHERGMTVMEAAFDIALGKYALWNDAERLVVNIQTLYDEFEGREGPRNPFPSFEQMLDLREKLAADCATGRCGHDHH